jgi:hypothetical protein
MRTVYSKCSRDSGARSERIAVFVRCIALFAAWH